MRETTNLGLKITEGNDNWKNIFDDNADNMDALDEAVTKDASTTEAGRVNTGAQEFAGTKTFTGLKSKNTMNVHGANSANYNVRLSGAPTDSGADGLIGIFSAMYNNLKSWLTMKVYGVNSQGKRINYYDEYKLPETAADKSANNTYDILTTKAVTLDASAQAAARGNISAASNADVANLTNGLNDLQGKVTTLTSNKIDKPTSVAAGKFLQTDSNGDAVWGNAASPTDVANAVTDWLDDNIPTGQTVAVDQSLTVSGAAADAKVVGGDISDLKSAFDDFKNGIDALNGNWIIGVLDRTTVYQNLKYMVCNPTIQQYDRNIVFSIASGYYLNVNYFDAQGTRTAAHSNRTGTFTVPSGTRFNVSVTENPLDTSLVITDMTRFVNAITFNTIVENRIEALEIATAEDSALVVDFTDGDTFITDGWQVGALDKTTVYPNVDKFTLSNPVIRSFDYDVVVHVKSGFKYTVNIFNENGERTSVVRNNTVDRVFAKGQRFNLYVNRNPVDNTEVITDKTAIEFKSAVYFRCLIGQELDELKKQDDSELVLSLNNGDTFITDGWQVGALDKTTVYPNVNKYSLSNPIIRSFDSDVVVHVKSGFLYNANIFDADGERISIIANVTGDRIYKKGERFNLNVKRNPADTSEVITDETKIEFQSAVYFRSIIGRELDELKKSVDPIADPNDYYFANDYLQNKCTDIDNLAKSCAANGDIFIFITDEHWTLNEKQSPALLRYISKHCNLPLLFDGGDNDDYGSPAFSTALRNSFTRKIHYVAGNHDWFPPTDGNMLYYWNDMQNNDQIGNPVEHYYYVDNIQKNIRYIILNAWVNNNGTLESGYSNEQLSWFTNTALNVPVGWDILVFTHFIGDSVTATPEGAQGFRNAIDAYNSDSSHTGKVIAIISGHTHFDAVCHTTGGVPIIMTTCDKNKENGIGNEPWLPEYRPSGTIYEQAFDIMFLDRANKKITALRIGCPAMDNTDRWHTDTEFDFAPTLEQRVINYN